MICRICNKGTHYCISCGWDEELEAGCCSTKCYNEYLRGLPLKDFIERSIDKFGLPDETVCDETEDSFILTIPKNPAYDKDRL